MIEELLLTIQEDMAIAKCSRSVEKASILSSCLHSIDFNKIVSSYTVTTAARLLQQENMYLVMSLNNT